MDGSKCILQLRGVRPFLSDKYDITKHKNYKYLSDANPKNAFDIARFVSTKLKVKPDEGYEHMEYAEPEDEMPPEAFGVLSDNGEPPDEQDWGEDLEPM
jgi:type IV secretion system protein VirD4